MAEPTAPTFAHLWGKLLNEWHDEVGPFHLLRPDGSPRCGVSYRSSTGPYPYDEKDCHPRCGRCVTIDGADERGRESQRKREAQAIPSGCIHGDAGGTCPPIPGCCRCGGSGRVDYESDEYPPGTNACCCTCAKCRERAREKAVEALDLETSRFQVIPRSHVLAVGAEITGLVEHGVPSREEAEAGARKTEAIYLHRHGPGCPPQDVIEVRTTRKLDGRPGAVAMTVLGRWPVGSEEVRVVDPVDFLDEVLASGNPVEVRITPSPEALARGRAAEEELEAKKAARELYANPEQGKVLEAIDTATSLVFLAEVERWEQGSRGRLTVQRHLLRRRSELEGPRFVARSAPRGKWGIWDHRYRRFVHRGDGGLRVNRFDTEAEAAQVATRCEVYRDEV